MYYSVKPQSYDSLAPVDFSRRVKITVTFPKAQHLYYVQQTSTHLALRILRHLLRDESIRKRTDLLDPQNRDLVLQSLIFPLRVQLVVDLSTAEQDLLHSIRLDDHLVRYQRL